MLTRLKYDTYWPGPSFSGQISHQLRRRCVEQVEHDSLMTSQFWSSITIHLEFLGQNQLENALRNPI